MNKIERSLSDGLLSVMAKDSISGSVKAMFEVIASGGASPELLLRGWATFEALARYLMPQSFTKPQTPGRVVEILAFEGYITPSEADILRKLAVTRNKFIHGDLEQSVSKEEIEAFALLLKKILDFEPENPERHVA